MNNFFCRECVAAAPFIENLLWSLGLLLVSLYCLYRCHRSFKKARLIEDMPRSLIRSASQGFTELIGIAQVNHDALIGPLSSEPCLWWKYTIEKYQRSSKSSSWITIESDASNKPFYIDDNSGLCLVIPEGADLTARHKRQWRGRHRRPLSAPETLSPNASRSSTRGLLEFLSTDISFGRNYRYTEYLIKDSDPLYILGHFESDASGQRTLTVEKIAGNILLTWKQDFAQLLDQYDQNSDGQLDIGEWQIVEAAAKKAAFKQQKMTQTEAKEHQIRKPSRTGLPFIIGGEEQETLSNGYRLRALVWSVAFLSAGSAATWYISVWST